VTEPASSVLYAAAALFCLAWAALIALAARGRLAAGLAIAPVAAAVWLGAVALQPDIPLDGIAGMAEILRSAAWFALLLALYWHAGRARVAGAVARFGIAGTLLAITGLVALLPGVGSAIMLPSLGSPSLLVRLALAIATVLLAENLYRNADEAARWHVNLPCIALGGLSILDLLLYADAVLSRAFSVAFLDARAVLTALAMPLLAIAAGRGRRLRRPLSVSRQVVFHGATLVVAGAFLLGIGLAGEAMRQLGAGESSSNWGRAVQISLVAVAAMAAAVAAASQTARSRIRRSFVDHFFAARYDYRREWLRCVDTLSADDKGEPEVRAIRAVADPADSPGGVLLLRDPSDSAQPAGEQARFRWAGSWNVPQAASLVLASDHPLVRAVRDGTWVPELGADTPQDIAASFGKLWLGVPLLHHREGTLGLVLLAPPRAPFPLDVETFDLLRTLGQEVAMFLAERRAAERLVDQRQLQDYAKRFAFVAHDVKTVSSQLSLLLANAEENIADPEFQRDMLMTVRASAERINTLIARLRQPETAAPSPRESTRGPAGEPDVVDPLPRLRAMAAARRHPVLVETEGAPPGLAAIAAQKFDAAVTHLLDNAIEASGQEVAVRIVLRAASAGRLEIDIIDQGPGMTPEFVRDRLFRPLDTSKAAGSGIGAWQARELLREAGGELSVLTRPGQGTTMRLSVRAQEGPAAPIAEARRLSA
jgi:putative PEP-CTERM system histidine kinase